MVPVIDRQVFVQVELIEDQVQGVVRVARTCVPIHRTDLADCENCAWTMALAWCRENGWSGGYRV